MLGLALTLSYFLKVFDTLENADNIHGIHFAEIINLQSLLDLLRHGGFRLLFWP